jgi:FkbM family methyltransferase
MVKHAVGRVLRRFAARYGYEIVATSQSSLGAQSSVDALAEHLRELFSALHIGAVIDVGANQGQYRDFLRERVGFDGTIISFEPIPRLAGMLQERSRADSLWRVYEFALGSRNETLPLHVSKRSGWSSFLSKDTVVRTEVAGAVVVEEDVTVQVRPLDDVLGALEPGLIESSMYLKVDAQGFDLEVLQGAERSLSWIRALQTELELLRIYAGAPGFQSVIQFLLDRGYDMTGAFPVWRDRALRIGEMDTVFRNMALAPAAELQPHETSTVSAAS